MKDRALLLPLLKHGFQGGDLALKLALACHHHQDIDDGNHPGGREAVT